MNWKPSDFISVGSAATFVLSIVYLLGCAIDLGLNLFLYFSLQDYFRFAIQWFPIVLVLLIAGALVEMLLRRVERGATEEQIAAATRNPELTMKVRRYSERALLGVLVFVTVLHTVLWFFKVRLVSANELFLLWGVTGGIVWLALVQWYVREPNMIERWSKGTFFFVEFFPALAWFVFFLGLSRGGVTPPFIHQPDVQIFLHESTAPFEGRVLFLLDDYVVLRKKGDDNITVMRRADVTTVLHPNKK
jgi:hypothetical protein